MRDFRNDTALVTGASAGIGREIARVLAREVRGLVLVARRQDRLEELATELRAARPDLRIMVRAVDLLDRAAVAEMLDGLERDGERIDVLVNNAGFGEYGFFDRRDWPRMEEMLELNIVSATFLLHRLIPSMMSRGHGAILNVGSFAGIAPAPAFAAYSASKAYVNHLSECLQADLAGSGVTVTVLCPGPVPTEFQGNAGTDVRPATPALFKVDVVDCAEQAVRAMKRGQARLIPGLAVRAAALAIETAPKPISRAVFRRMGKKLRGSG